MILHVTNGRAIVPKIREVGIPGEIVTWDDVLHEGPVPAALDTDALRTIRAAFIAEGWPVPAQHDVERDLQRRDQTLQDALTGRSGVDEIVLWLEHDLYDQLQLIQILDRVEVDAPPVSAVPDDDYLGHQPASRFASLFANRRRISRVHCEIARAAWQAFRSPDPLALSDVLARVTIFPHLGPALRRHLQQFPSVVNGLSRTEQQALDAIRDGARVAKDVYRAANHEREDAVFMGDLAFLSHMASLFDGARPLLRRAGPPRTEHPADGAEALQEEWVLTEDGRQVLAGDADRVALCGIDRWLGGVHLTGHGPVWRWDPAASNVRVA